MSVLSPWKNLATLSLHWQHSIRDTKNQEPLVGQKRSQILMMAHVVLMNRFVSYRHHHKRHEIAKAARVDYRQAHEKGDVLARLTGNRR